MVSKQQSRGHWRRGDEPEINPYIRRALRRGPIGLLVLVSMLMYATEPRRKHQIGVAPAAAGRSDLVAWFLANPTPEATAVLAVLAEFLCDDVELVAAVRAELAGRPPATPHSLARLAETRIDRLIRVSEILDSNDALLLHGRIPGAGGFTCIVELDLAREDLVHYVGVARGSAEQVLTTIDPAYEIRCEDIDLADARARIGEAFKLQYFVRARDGSQWPELSALVEWLIRLLPDGGSPQRRPEWCEGDVAALIGRFSASPQGVLFGRRHRELVESVVDFGVENGAGDPLRWNETRAKRWLFDHVLDDEYAPWIDGLEAAPYLLRAFIRFAHDEVGIRPGLTAEVLAAIEAWEADFHDKAHRMLDAS